MRLVVSIVVLAVVGLLAVGLFLSMAARSRGNAERARCQDNLRRIGHYLVDELETTKVFPAGTVNVVDKRPPERRVSWVVPGLTRLGHEQLFKAIDVTAPWDVDPNKTAGQRTIVQFICPGIADLRPADGFGPIDYPGMAGVGPDAARKPADARGAGLLRYDEPTPVADVKDGLSNTLMLLETADHVGPWIAGGFPTVRPLDPATRPYLGLGRPFGGCHPGGANAALADGSVRFIAENINQNPLALELMAGIADSVRPADSQ